MKRLASILVIVAAAAGAWAEDAARSPDSAARTAPIYLKLRAQATVHGATATLADVLVLAEVEPELVQRIGPATIAPPALPLRTAPRGGPAAGVAPAAHERASGTGAPATTVRMTITHDQVRRRLDELGVNLGRVLLSGAAECTVTLQPPAPRPVRTTEFALAAAEEPEAALLRPATSSCGRQHRAHAGGHPAGPGGRRTAGAGRQRRGAF